MKSNTNIQLAAQITIKPPSQNNQRSKKVSSDMNKVSLIKILSQISPMVATRRLIDEEEIAKTRSYQRFLITKKIQCHTTSPSMDKLKNESTLAASLNLQPQIKTPSFRIQRKSLCSRQKDISNLYLQTEPIHLRANIQKNKFVTQASSTQTENFIEDLSILYQRLPNQSSIYQRTVETPRSYKRPAMTLFKLPSSQKIRIEKPKVSATSWVIYNATKKRMISNFNSEISLEVASLTKIVTALVASEILDQYKIPVKTFVRVSKKASRKSGTSAGLRGGDNLTFDDLFHAMMLPSGNDAAHAIAETCGMILVGQIRECYDVDLLLKSQVQIQREQLMTSFYSRMNDIVNKKGLFVSNFCSCDGLPNNKNRSCAMEIAIFGTLLLENSYLKQVVRTLTYKCTINGPEGMKQYNWSNTNKLLRSVNQKLANYTGLKTGTTDPAGPCLAASLRYLNKLQFKDQKSKIILQSFQIVPQQRNDIKIHSLLLNI